MHTRTAAFLTIALAASTLNTAGCSDYSRTAGTVPAQRGYVLMAEESMARFRRTDPTLDRFFDHAHGYAVFPRITKGAAGIGAAHGKGGVVYEGGEVVGFAEVTQVTVGAQLGGQGYEEIIFFENRRVMDDFKSGRLEFAANASAVAAASGAAASADYASGVAVFTMPIGGLMFEASIGGQKFRFTPKE
jgi:lipid-binding SYLF domain-containing protein